VTLAFLALFAVNRFEGIFTAKFAKSRKAPQRGSKNQALTLVPWNDGLV